MYDKLVILFHFFSPPRKGEEEKVKKYPSQFSTSYFVVLYVMLGIILELLKFTVFSHLQKEEECRKIKRSAKSGFKHILL